MIGDLLDWTIVIPWVLGILFGLFVGSTPGLTATMAVALVVPVSFYLPNSLGGLAMILGVSFTAIFAGDLPATFLKIPGTPASAAATLDAHAMHLRGRGGVAIHLNLICSCIGGLAGVVLLAILGPWIAKWSLRMDSPEYFWLAILGISVSAVVSGSNLWFGVLSAVCGVFLSTIGLDTINGAQRMTFHHRDLMDGIELIPMMIGLFGLAEVLQRVASRGQDGSGIWKPVQLKGTFLEAARIAISFPGTILRSSLLGTMIGALPGAGADIGSWVGYGAAKKLSRTPEQFGTGDPAGVIAPTSANNAAVAGAWIPALVFGIPGDAVTAIVLGAFIMYDIQPGPHIFESSPDGSPTRVQSLIWIAAITQFLLLGLGLVGIRCFALILRLPPRILEAIILIFCFLGAYSIRNSSFDLIIMLISGLVGWFMNGQRIPVAPLLLGFILGETVEKQLRSGLIASSGNPTPFFTSPFFFAFVLIVLVSILTRKKSDLRRGS